MRADNGKRRVGGGAERTSLRADQSLPASVHRITLGLWFVTAVGTGILIWAMAKQSDAWLLFWTPAIGVSGYLLSRFLMRLTSAAMDEPGHIRWLAIFAGVIVVTLAQAVFDHLLWDYFMRMTHPTFHSDWAGGIGFNIMMYIWLFASYVATLLLVLSIQASSERAREIAQSQDLARKALFQKSRYQMSPRLLGMTFEHVWTLLERGNVRAAEETVQRFSEYLRWMLSTSADGRATVGDEIAAVESCLVVAGVQSGPLNIRCPDTVLEARIPTHLLQALLECFATSESAFGRVRSVEIRKGNAEAIICVECLPCSADPVGDPADCLERLWQTFQPEGVVIERLSPSRLEATVPLLNDADDRLYAR